MKTDWSTDSDNRTDNQAIKPIWHETTSDRETKTEEDQHILVEVPLRRPNTIPKVLTNGKWKYPLANWTSVVKGQINNSLNEVHSYWTCVVPRPRFRLCQEAEKFWQRQSEQTDNRTIDGPDEAEQQEEEDQIQSDVSDERQWKSYEKT